MAHVPLSIPSLDVLLPVGISFYTFQEVSYVIDVYRGQLPAQRRLGIFALYVSYFPQLVAGPIERSHRLMPQLTARRYFCPEQAVYGLRQILWGMCKKVVIADNLATWVDQVYTTPAAYSGPVLTLGTVCFAFQIYCDFSGYSDIALGSARIMGIRLMQNFDRPYLSRSIAEFWQRWHISLSTWFRDYIYIPLGGRRVSTSRWCVNIIIVFALSGLWHGADWTFIAWGLLHGLYYICGKMSARPREAILSSLRLEKLPRLHGMIQTMMTFALVCFAWIFFRAKDMETAWAVISGLPYGWDLLLHLNYSHFAMVMAILSSADLGSGILYGSIVTGCMFLVLGYEMCMRHADWSENIARYPALVRWTAYLVICMAALNFGVSRVIPFQYFQF